MLETSIESLFQSTRPVRGETLWIARYGDKNDDFNPLAPCGARLGAAASSSSAFPISIHSPRAGRDDIDNCPKNTKELFQSTRPVRGETMYYDDFLTLPKEFQSTRPVRGETRMTELIEMPEEFQSTRPVRGETAFLGEVPNND